MNWKETWCQVKDWLEKCGLKEWQTLAGAVFGFFALAMTTYVTGCQQRQATSEERQHHTAGVRSVFLVEMETIKVDCAAAAKQLSESQKGEAVYINLLPYDQYFQQFFSEIVTLTPEEIAAIYQENYEYNFIQAKLREMSGTTSAEGLGTLIKIAIPAEKSQLIGILRDAASDAQLTIDTLTKASLG